MTHKEILEQTKSELDRLVSEAKRKLDGLATPNLEVGKWYWKRCWDYRILFCFQGYCNNHFGFNGMGKWSNLLGQEGNETAIEATDQEVEDALIKEAVRRGFKDNVIIDNSPLGFEYNSIHDEGGNMFYKYGYLNIGHKGLAIFHEGKWAEVIEKPVDEFAELKEAHKNGAIIECLQSDGKWFEIEDPQWQAECEYRIKPEEKTTLDQDIKALKEKYPNLKFTITVEDNL